MYKLKPIKIATDKYPELIDLCPSIYQNEEKILDAYIDIYGILKRRCKYYDRPSTLDYFFCVENA